MAEGECEKVLHELYSDILVENNQGRRIEKELETICKMYLKTGGLIYEQREFILEFLRKELLF